MRRASFGIAALCIMELFFSSGAFSQSITLPADAASHPAPEDIIGGTIFSPNGIAHIVGDGMGGGFIFGPAGISTFVSNGIGGGTLYAPNTTGSIIADGMGGGILYSTKGVTPSSQQPTPGNPPAPQTGSRKLVGR